MSNKGNTENTKHCKDCCKNKGYELSSTAVSLAYLIGKNLTNIEREILGTFLIILGQNLFSIGAIELMCQVMCEEKTEENEEIIEQEEASF